MNILLTGYDGYEGFPLAIRLLKEGHTVFGIDSGIRRAWVGVIGSVSAIPIHIQKERDFQLKKLGDFHSYLIDLKDSERLSSIFRRKKIDFVIHLAGQPSAPWSMKSISNQNVTMKINFESTINLVNMLSYYHPKAKMIFISTMGEYGTPDKKIPEGFDQITSTTKAPASRDPGSWYHLSKVMCTQALYLHHKLTGLNISVIMQGVVYGTRTSAMDKEHTTRFDFDKYFGTVLNRFVAQSLIKEPMTIYGKGNQQRGMLSLDHAIETIVHYLDDFCGFKIRNNISFITSIKELAENIQSSTKEILGYTPKIKEIKNPRIEKDYHQYSVKYYDRKAIGLAPISFNSELKQMFEELEPYKKAILKYKDSM